MLKFGTAFQQSTWTSWKQKPTASSSSTRVHNEPPPPPSHLYCMNSNTSVRTCGACASQVHARNVVLFGVPESVMQTVPQGSTWI
ncbi:unnamed protein product [Amoebophrya sp. A120]|nr:unnamed protein product [Amoebophrya sp. A120]|eukprot:GSA120T00007795001.1